MSPGPLTFEDAGAAAADLLAAIHETSFDRPWSAGDFAGLLAMPGTAALVAAASGSGPSGMIVFRRAAGEAEILTLAVRPDMRFSGIAAALLDEMLLRLKHTAASVFLEVAPANDAARALYRSRGFAEAGRRPGYYGARGEAGDALVLRAELR